ncbi:MAG: ABC transporter ATP-binding protein [Gammaproteobacteria bacterium]|nr:ABC transporter ATP-binding protein [Gammaproteobacteria bacterium]
MSETLVEINNLTWRVNQKNILSNINIKIKTGQFVGIIGTNGAGKSSLLRNIYRYIKPTSGTITLSGIDIWDQKAKNVAQQIAVVQQSSDHLPYSVFEIVKMGLTPHKSFFQNDNKDDDARIAQAISDVGLTSLSDVNYEQLSGGEQQRTLIARAIVQNTQLLIMDEPTNHLDIHYQIDILILLQQGQILAHGTPREVLTQRIIAKAYQVDVSINEHPVHHNPQLMFHYNSSDDNASDYSASGQL